MSTKSPHNQQGDTGPTCSASVEYKGRKGACRREGKYPDIDGIRWWCGLHRPDRRSGRPTPQPDGEVEVIRTSASVSVRPVAGEKPKSKPTLQPAYEGSGKVVDTDILLSVSQSQTASSEAMEALEIAQSALIEISNTNTVGWDALKSVENYKILINHMAERAREASEKVTAAIRYLKT